MRKFALEISDLVVRRERKHVLHGLSLSVEEGELFALAGVNGAGKTSLIKCMLDFLSAESGEVHFFGMPNRQPVSRKEVGFLPERFVPPYYLTGADFLKYMLEMQNVPYDPEAADAMLSALDLDPAALNNSVRSASKGMTQKLGLAACLLTRRKLYILDEPTSGLDPKARALFKSQLLKAKAQGSTVFFSSHALADVDELCDRMAILHQGALRFVGTPAECRNQFACDTLEQAFLKCIGASGDNAAARQPATSVNR